MEQGPDTRENDSGVTTVETPPSKRKTAIVTGGTQGIGLAISERLARDGYNLVICFRTNEEAAGVAREKLKKFGTEIEVVQMDVSTLAGAILLIKTATSRFGQLDVLVNNAGITRDTLLMRMSEDDWDAVLTTNLKSAFLCTKAAIRPMLRQRSGRIINISSVVGLGGQAGQANYAAAKAGLIGFTKSIAKEVGSRGITVNAIAPGFIDTRMTVNIPPEMRETLLAGTPLGRFGEPEDVAGAVAFLVGPDARFITGHILTVDGGLLVQS